MNIRQEVQQLKSKLVAWRRDFHRYPEAGWTEFRTASIVAAELTRIGWTVIAGREACRSESRMGVPPQAQLEEAEKRALAEGADPAWVKQLSGGHTAVVGRLATGKPGPVIALRFDIDSNELSESTAPDHLPNREGFASAHPGLMHACGHDGHTAIGLGVAELLYRYKDRLCGEIRLLFQPAEEGCRGAKAMVDAGWLDGVDLFLSGHIGVKNLQLGRVVAATGKFLSTAKIDVQYRGTAAHAGVAPQEGRNALLAAAAAALHLHGISRHSGGATRINVGTLQAGTGRNVVPDLAEMKVETRGETAELNDYMLQEALRIIESTANIYGVECRWEIVGRANDVQSNPELIPLIREAAEQVDGIDAVDDYVDFGGSEDAVTMMERVQQQGGKATYMLFGTPLQAGHHQERFDFSEEVLPAAVELLTRSVLTAASTQLQGGKER